MPIDKIFEDLFSVNDGDFSAVLMDMKRYLLLPKFKLTHALSVYVIIYLRSVAIFTVVFIFSGG